MTSDEVERLLGNPSYQDQGAAATTWLYFFPERLPAPAGMQVAGVHIDLTNNVVAHWSTIEAGPKSETLWRAAASEAEAEIKVYSLNAFPIPGGKFIDSKRFPQLGYVPPRPELTIRGPFEVESTQARTTTAEGIAETNWAFTIELNSSYAKDLARVTSSNMLKRMVFTVNDEPLLAPLITMPIETGRLRVEISDPSSAAALKEALQRR